MTRPRPAPPYDGGCTCGRLRYRVTGEPLTLYACHCTDCQTRSGSAFGLSMFVPRVSFEIARGEAKLVEVDLADGRRKRMRGCAECGVRPWGEPRVAPGIVTLHPGTLDDASWLAPVAHIWTASRQPWIEIPADTLAYTGQPADMLPLIEVWRRG